MWWPEQHSARLGDVHTTDKYGNEEESGWLWIKTINWYGIFYEGQQFTAYFNDSLGIEDLRWQAEWLPEQWTGYLWVPSYQVLWHFIDGSGKSNLLDGTEVLHTCHDERFGSDWLWCPDCWGLTHYFRKVISATWWGINAGVNQPEGMTGPENDDYCAWLWAIGGYGDEAMITGSMCTELRRLYFLLRRQLADYKCHIYVYVTDDYYGDWREVANFWLPSWVGKGWVGAGPVSGYWRYFAICVYYDIYPAVFYVDSVCVTQEYP